MNQATTATLVKMILLSIVLSIFESAQSSTPAREETTNIRNFIGTWVNVDNNTQGIEKVVIFNARGPKVQVFGSCSPNACDWGTQSAKAYAYFSNSATSMEVTYNPSFSIKLLDLNLSHKNQVKRIHISSYTRFTDNSGREDYTSDSTFRQVFIKPIPNKHNSIKNRPNMRRLTPAQIRAKRLAEWHQAQIRAKRLAEWYRAHPDKRPKKR